MRLLRALCGDDHLHYELTRELLDVERQYQTMARRAGLYEALDQAFRRSFYTDAEDATSRARQLREALHTARAEEDRYGLQPAESAEE